MRYFLGLLTLALVGFGGPLNAQEGTAVKEYKYKGETFQLDDSKGCYVAVTYKHLTGHVKVNTGDNRSDQSPYRWSENGSSGPRNSFKEALDTLCARLLRNFRTEEAAKAFDPAKYCAELHDAVKNLP